MPRFRQLAELGLARAHIASALLLGLFCAGGCIQRCPPAQGPAAGALAPPPVCPVTTCQERRDGDSGERSVAEQADQSGEPELLEDDVASPEAAAVPEPQAIVHPLDGVGDAEISRRVEHDLASLGSMSIGLPHRGQQVNAVQMPQDPRWILVDKSHAWGTEETVQYLERAIARVYEQFPDAPPLHIGHISGKAGGFLRPHRSHQSGRDVDLGYFYAGGGHWYLRADDTSLDTARTWALVRALIVETDVRFILIDRSIQTLLRAHAESIGEDDAWLEDVFRGRGPQRPPLIRHVPGHRTHMHVRFYNPLAQETARRSYAGLVRHKVIKPPQHYLQHKVKKGETLIHLAKRYGTTVGAIKRANRLRSNKILARKSYKIPRTGPASAGPRVAIPPRRLPPKNPQP